MSRVSSAAQNRYYRCLTYHDRPTPWDIHDPEKSERSDYLRKTLQVMERHLEWDGLTFYVTWKLDELPSYGKNVVAIVMGDEWSQVPAYAHRVLATFKCYGAFPKLAARPLHAPTYLNALLTAKYIQMRLHHLRGALRHRFHLLKHRLQGQDCPPIYDFPLGYGNQLELPIKPITERSLDVFFAGSIEQGGSHPVWSPRHWLRSPKVVARNHMIQAIDQLAKDHPAFNIRIHTNDQFVLNALEYGLTEPGEVLDAQTYSETLMDTKICLVPRGTSPETFRFFEGLRYGCILITERLPSRWFYDGAPVIQVDDWSELDMLIPALLNDPQRMEELHGASLEWWDKECSEAAVGQFIANKIS